MIVMSSQSSAEKAECKVLDNRWLDLRGVR